jgi:hypothetical protein
MIFDALIKAILILICLGIDITIFFLLIRLVLSRWKIGWLGSFDQAGDRLVTVTAESTSKIWLQFTQKHLSIRGQLCVAVIGLTLVRLFLGSFLKVL